MSSGLLDWPQGRTLYVRTDNPAILRVGTVEDEDAQAYWISCSSPTGIVREPSEYIENTRVLQPSDIENVADTDKLLYVHGRRLVRYTGHGCVEVLEILESLTQIARTVRARRLKYVGCKWEADEEPADYPTDAFGALEIAFIQKWRYFQPVDPDVCG
jgi:hypothetical protein